MKEASFIRAVCSKLPAGVVSQSMTGASLTTNGTPDRYFDMEDGAPHDLWVEFKYATLTRNGVDSGKLLSALQKKWLHRRWYGGKNACVMIGIKSDWAQGIVLERPDLWEGVVPYEYIELRLQTARELANYIFKRLT